MARTGPAGPPGPMGSGTADRTMAAADEDDDFVAADDIDGSSDGGPDDMAKGHAARSLHAAAIWRPATGE